MSIINLFLKRIISCSVINLPDDKLTQIAMVVLLQLRTANGITFYKLPKLQSTTFFTGTKVWKQRFVLTRHNAE
jgi:hypothetical protein